MVRKVIVCDGAGKVTLGVRLGDKYGVCTITITEKGMVEMYYSERAVADFVLGVLGECKDVEVDEQRYRQVVKRLNAIVEELKELVRQVTRDMRG